MSWFIARSGRAFLTLLLLLTFAFFTLSASGDPALQKLGPDASQAALQALRTKMGLDLPLWKQFLIYLDGLIHFDLGTSYRTGGPAIDLVMDRVPVTLSLMLPTIFISIGAGVFTGLCAAMYEGRVSDKLTMLIAVFGLAVPPFLIGIFLMYVFSIWLGWLQPSGYVNWTSFIMPVASLSLIATAIFARFTRSAMIEVMNHPMIETAKASGLAAKFIQRVHVLPNALLPLITIIALQFGNIITWAAVVESLFSWPGAGQLLIKSVSARDNSVVVVILLLTGTTMIVANFLADLSYGLIDPRIRDARRLGTKKNKRKRPKQKPAGQETSP